MVRMEHFSREYIKDLVPVTLDDNNKLTISEEKCKREIPKYWDAEYIKKKIDNTTNEKQRMLLRFLWMTGVRVTEAIGVTKENIDFRNHTIKVRWLKNRKYQHRMIPIHPLLLDVLRVFSANLKLSERLFSYSRQWAWRIVRKRMGGHPHQFRHSFAVHWLRNGGDVVVLHRILGHARIQTTMEYLKIVPTDQGKELLKIPF